MVTDFSKISEQHIQKICELFDLTHDINYIKNTLPCFEYNMIFSALVYSGKYGDSLREYMCQDVINDMEILFISDTHFGSKYDNIVYSDKVFDFAVCNGFNTIFHCGDILHGTPSNDKAKISSLEQLEFFLENYPHDKGIITFALLGNHDYSAINDCEKIYYDLNLRDDVNILGSKSASINWNGLNMGLKHKIDEYRLNFLGSFQNDLTFKGHSHYFRYRNGGNIIHVPSLCNDPSYAKAFKSKGKRFFEPGFLTAEMFDDCVVITNYYFDNNNSIVKGSEHPLIKKYKNTSY